MVNNYHARQKSFRKNRSIEICALIKLALESNSKSEINRYLEEIKELVLSMV